MTNRFGALERELRRGRPTPRLEYVASLVDRINASPSSMAKNRPSCRG
jgi:hypothetical protein